MHSSLKKLGLFVFILTLNFNVEADDCPQLKNGPLTKEQAAMLSEIQLRAGNLQCQDLEIGGSRLVSATNEQSPTSVHDLYKLTRKAKDDYEIVLNLKYGAQQAGKSEGEAINQKFHLRAQYCYNRADPALLGPNGEHLHLRLAKPDEPEPVPPEHDIVIQSESERGDSDNYNGDSYDCPTLIHESLHLLGLVDEYSEEHIGLIKDPLQPGGVRYVAETKLPAYDCRTQGNMDSVMTAPLKAWWKSFGIFSHALTRLECFCYEAKCKDSIKHPDLNLTECPAGMGSMSSYVPPNEENTTPLGIEYADGHHYRAIVDNYHFTGKSILEPKHFNAIVHPGCGVNFPYYQCSINAYKTSLEHNGTGCNPVPAFCNSGG